MKDFIPAPLNDAMPTVPHHILPNILTEKQHYHRVLKPEMTSHFLY